MKTKLKIWFLQNNILNVCFFNFTMTHFFFYLHEDFMYTRVVFVWACLVQTSHCADKLNTYYPHDLKCTFLLTNVFLLCRKVCLIIIVVLISCYETCLCKRTTFQKCFLWGEQWS